MEMDKATGMLDSMYFCVNGPSRCESGPFKQATVTACKENLDP
jgi:hypothetical protein